VSDLAIRPADIADAATLMRLIRELAAFENMAHLVEATEEDIRREGFGAQPHFEAVLAEQNGQAVGFALFFHNFSTFMGRPGLYVEDLYISESARGSGLGRKLMAYLARLALARGCPRLELSVLHWNPARAFYEKIGLVQNRDWLPYRVSGEALSDLARQA